MANWRLLDNETAHSLWDQNLVRLAEGAHFQAFAWGEYNRAIGWTPLYFAAFDENEQIVAMCLGLLRRYPLGVGLMWSVGGPVGDINEWDIGFRNFVISSTGLKHVYFRFRCDREKFANDVSVLNGQGWTPSKFRMTSGMTMELDVTQTSEQLMERMSPRWRRNLRRAGKNPQVVRQITNPDIEMVSRSLAEMENRKRIPALFSPDKLEKLFEHVSDNLLFLQCEDSTGNVLGFRATLILGDRTCDYFAATTEQGLQTRASYQIVWELLSRCRDLGVVLHDLGGIDPVANPGVYDFKRRTGARQVESLGEWDWATSPWLRIVGNWAIKRRHETRSVRSTRNPVRSDKTLEMAQRAKERRFTP